MADKMTCKQNSPKNQALSRTSCNRDGYGDGYGGRICHHICHISPLWSAADFDAGFINGIVDRMRVQQ
jgi:hypothetical protein